MRRREKSVFPRDKTSRNRSGGESSRLWSELKLNWPRYDPAPIPRFSPAKQDIRLRKRTWVESTKQTGAFCARTEGPASGEKYSDIFKPETSCKEAKRFKYAFLSSFLWPVLLPVPFSSSSLCFAVFRAVHLLATVLESGFYSYLATNCANRTGTLR